MQRTLATLLCLLVSIQSYKGGVQQFLERHKSQSEDSQYNYDNVPYYYDVLGQSVFTNNYDYYNYYQPYSYQDTQQLDSLIEKPQYNYAYSYSAQSLLQKDKYSYMYSDDYSYDSMQQKPNRQQQPQYNYAYNYLAQSLLQKEDYSYQYSDMEDFDSQGRIWFYESDDQDEMSLEKRQYGYGGLFDVFKNNNLNGFKQKNDKKEA